MIRKALGARRAILLCACAISCATPSLERFSRPLDRPAVEITENGRSLVRSIYCDITVEPLGRETLRRLLGRSSEGRSCISGRLAPLLVFHVIIRSTVDMPIRVERTELVHAGGIAASLDAGTLRARLSPARHSDCDPGAVFRYRRLLEERASWSAIDPGVDTVESRLDFIPPRDIVEGMIVFDRIPTASRSYTLRFSIDAMGRTRDVEFPFEIIERRVESGNGPS
jgi:hypothetical protein